MINFRRYLIIIALALTSSIVIFMLPSLCAAQDLYDERHSHNHNHVIELPYFKYLKEANELLGESDTFKQTDNISSLWIEAFSATFIISFVPFLILFFVPVNNKLDEGSLLKIMLSFAAGGLLGDAFLHLIPHALEPYELSLEQNPAQNSNTGPWVLAGLFMFFIIDKCMRLIKLDHDHSPKNESDQKIMKQDEKKKEKNNSDAKSETESDGKIEVAGYLNLVADFTHNFTDGLAIGASFLAGQKVGLITTFSIFCHEIPHEIGDFAILIQSGCSKKKAMMFQLLTATGALCGTLVSLITDGLEVGATSPVLPFTAGGFTYIALVSIMPEILKESSFVQSMYEISALLLGIFIMVIVAQFE